jgi:multicomponent Na+:H+ antiporter subunit G
MLAATFFLGAGAVLLLIAAIGVVRLPDALSRQHAATKAGTLALATVCLGAALAVVAGAVPEDTAGGAVMRLALLVAVLLPTLPVASHLLARAAARELFSDSELAQAPLVLPGAHDGPPDARSAPAAARRPFFRRGR